jgi:hypothetical protein
MNTLILQQKPTRRRVTAGSLALALALAAPAFAATTPKAALRAQRINAHAKVVNAHLNGAVMRNAAFVAEAARWLADHVTTFPASATTGIRFSANRVCVYQIQPGVEQEITLDWHWHGGFTGGFCGVAMVNKPSAGYVTLITFMPDPNAGAVADLGYYQSNWTGLKAATADVAKRLAARFLAPGEAVIALDQRMQGTVQGSRLSTLTTGDTMDLHTQYGIYRRFLRPSVACVLIMKLPE